MSPLVRPLTDRSKRQAFPSDARVAELADALDSGFHFQHFHGAASRFKKSDKTLYPGGLNTLSSASIAGFKRTAILSQLVSQSVPSVHSLAKRPNSKTTPHCVRESIKRLPT
jgi:hypothetical protein